MDLSIPLRGKNVKMVLGGIIGCFKENLNAPIDLLSIPQSGGKMSKRLGEIVGCKYKTSPWHLNEFPDGSNIGATVQIVNAGDKPTVILYTYTNRHAGHQTKSKNKTETM